MNTPARLLALDTSSRVGRLALAEGLRVVAERDISAGQRYGSDLLVALDVAVRAAGWSPTGIDLVALSIGPGSFTGLRIAVMFARTLAWRTGARIVTVPTLRVIAENAPPPEPLLGVVTDAQRGGLYWAAYRRKADGSLVPTIPEAVGETAEAAEQLPREALLLGDALERYTETFASWRQAERSLWAPRAGTVAALGWRKHLAGEYTAAEQLEPLYVRRPAPEEVWERRQRGGR